VRVLHFTDLHLFVLPSPRRLLGKRLLGTANLYLARRVDHFSRHSVEALVRAVDEQEPDLCLCSGDLTGMGSPAEFELARRVLAPLLDRHRVVMVPGNHDVYTRGAQRERRFEAFFGAWSGGGTYPAVHRHGDVTVVGLDCCRPHPLLASGVLPSDQLHGLAELLESGAVRDGFTILLLHYPLRNAQGQPYGSATRHLVNASELEAVLRSHPGIDLIVHGHEHHGFRSELPTPHGAIPIIDPGAGGRTESSSRHETAHFAIYEIEDGAMRGMERWALAGERFVPEPGGPYATGR
jgi:3',5'-cyclic AMP phosphodiesterase CpdA